MYEVTIRDYIGKAKELKAAQVRRLEAGTKVIRHSFDGYGRHCTLEATVAQDGTSKILKARNYYTGDMHTYRIVKESDRLCYTEA